MPVSDYRSNFVIKNSETGNWTSSSDVNGEYYEVEGVDEKDLPAPARIAINTIRNRFNTKGNGGQLGVQDTKSKLIPKKQSFRKFQNSGKIEIQTPEGYLNVVDPRTHLISSVISQDSRTRIKNNKQLNQSATQDFTLDEVDDGSTVFSGSKNFNNYGKPANHRIYHKNNLDGTIDYSYYVNGEIMNHGENIQPDQMDNMARYQYESMLNSLKNRGAGVQKKENGGQIEESTLRNRLSKEWPSSQSLPEYRIYPDTTFTKDKTGIGDIEYINQPVITYPNGYQLINPTGKPTLVVNPNTNTYEDVKLDLLHHYRNHPVYTDLLDQYSQAQLDYANLYDDSWVKGDALYGMRNGINKKDAWRNAIDGSLRALLYVDDDQLRKSHRYPTLEESQNYLPDKYTREHFNSINRFLHSYVLPEVTVTPNR